MYLPQMAKGSDTDPKELIGMIEQRVDDVKALRGKHV
jgi:hypothetical protein